MRWQCTYIYRNICFESGCKWRWQESTEAVSSSTRRYGRNPGRVGSIWGLYSSYKISISFSMLSNSPEQLLLRIFLLIIPLSLWRSCLGALASVSLGCFLLCNLFVSLISLFDSCIPFLLVWRWYGFVSLKQLIVLTKMLISLSNQTWLLATRYMFYFMMRNSEIYISSDLYCAFFLSQLHALVEYESIEQAEKAVSLKPIPHVL